MENYKDKLNKQHSDLPNLMPSLCSRLKNNVPGPGRENQNSLSEFPVSLLLLMEVSLKQYKVD